MEGITAVTMEVETFRCSFLGFNTGGWLIDDRDDMRCLVADGWVFIFLQASLSMSFLTAD